MSHYKLLLGMDPLLRRKSVAVDPTDSTLQPIIDSMLYTINHYQALGVAAPMFGVAKQIIAVATDDTTILTMLNPVITFASDQLHEEEEGSLCFPSIAAKIKRPYEVEVTYQTQHGETKTLRGEGLLSSALQHEIDYLHGKLFTDYIPPVKRNMLLTAMEKQIRQHKAHGHHHVHTDACNHG